MPDTAARLPSIQRGRRSPNHTERRGVDRPDMIVLHYTGMESCAAAVQRLCDPVAEVSAHYVVDIDGTIHELVDETRRAWHAGRASWGSIGDINSHSVGIEIVNPGHALGYPPFPEPQMRSVEFLVHAAMQRWEILPQRVVGHACVAPGRKIDPGEKFDWRRLALQNLAVWLDPVAQEEGLSDGTSPDAGAFRGAAKRIGYAVPEAQGWCADLNSLWSAFAMRFLPGQANSPPSAAGIAHAQRIADRWPVAKVH